MIDGLDVWGYIFWFVAGIVVGAVWREILEFAERRGLIKLIRRK
jgi:hypothetical protein